MIVDNDKYNKKFDNIDGCMNNCIEDVNDEVDIGNSDT